MVQNTIHATYTETYDLNTAIGELSMLAFHTPQSDALKNQFKGFFEQYKKYKILGCNFRMVCLSQQALTPDMIGLTAGKVDPRDIANPILFKAVTGEGLNVLLDQIYNDSTAINRLQVGSVSQHVDTRTEAIDAYYTMLSDDSWRREHPQKGITVMGLKPMVHRIVSTQPFKWTGSTGTGVGAPRIGTDAGSSTPTSTGSANLGFGAPSGTQNNSHVSNPSVFVSNGLIEMPWLDTTVDMDYVGANIVDDTTVQLTGLKKGYGVINNVPRVYMGCMILPPAILQRLFFRLQVVWHVAFKDFRPAFEVGPLSGTSTLEYRDGMNSKNDTYFNIYHSAIPDTLTKEMSSFDSNGLAEVDKVTEKVA